MIRISALIATLLGVIEVSARRSPNANYVQNLKNSPEGSSYTDNVFEDAMLDAPSLIAKYGYPVEVHHVETSDGYILELHRIPYGRGASPGNRTAVLLMHGLLSSSADFVTTGPGNALGYILADAGYDVWLGNARGNYYSRHHITLNPDNILFKKFWKFSWDEIGNYDLPAFIDRIIQTTGQKKIHYIGHSQGGTTFLVLNTLRPEYNDKFISFQGLAPACFFENNENFMFNALSGYGTVLESIAFMINYQEFLGSKNGMSRQCVSGSILYNFCKSALYSRFKSTNFNSTLVPLIFGHTPAGASVRQIAHYGQVIHYNKFRRFKHNLAITNILKYGTRNPPAYDLSLITVPSYLYYGLGDEQVDYRDLLKLADTLPNVIAVKKAERDTFNHFDFLWAMDVKEMVYDNVIASMREAEKRFPTTKIVPSWW